MSEPSASAISAASAAPHLRRLLDLLADDAPAEALGAVSSQARAAGVPAGDLAEVERGTAAALRIRGALRQHRRRELQLTALFDTAGDLAASRDLDDVLKAIVRRARMLLGTDTAYLTLPDEEAGDTYMRVTDGSVSVVFQRLRLELGHGLGGLVAQTARPYATHDYRTDDRFHHTRNINAGVLDEGLVAILGVPLLLGSSRGGTGKVIGVLFAADRAPRVFSPDEVALLCSLAAHAAIAIDTARALADTRSALDELAYTNAELAEANAAVREHSAAMRRAEESHDRLTDLVLRGRDVKDVAAAVAGLLDSPLTIHDPGGRPLAAVRPDGADFAADGMDAGWLAETAEESRTGARAVHRDGRWICAVLAGQELLAGLVLHRRGQLDDSDRRLFERASVVTGLLLLLRRTVAETENRIRGELISDLLTDADRDPAGLTERGRRLGIDLDRPHLLLVAESGARERLAPAAMRYLFGGDIHGVSAEHAGAVVLLVAAGDPGPAAGDAARAAAAQLGQARPDPRHRRRHRPGTRRPRTGRRLRGGRPLPARDAGPRTHRRGGLRRGTRLPGRGPGQRPGRRRLRLGDARPAAGVRRAARHPPGAHPRRLLRLRGQPRPGQGRTPRARQHGGAAAGPGAGAARARLERTGSRPGTSTRAAAAPVDRRPGAVGAARPRCLRLRTGPAAAWAISLPPASPVSTV